MRYADLHVHTAYSDGTFSPGELVAEGVKAGLAAVSVVDHDTVEGIEPAIEASRGSGLEVVSGIELTAEFEGAEIHILGYLLDHRDPELGKKLLGLKEDRRLRVFKILKKLKEATGVDIDPDAVFGISGKGTVGRLHIAQAMVASGAVGSVYEAFKKYIGDRSPAYVSGFRFSPAQAIALIRESQGIPVLAHPYSLGNDALIPLFVKDGLMGIEAYYPEHSSEKTNVYLALAEKHGLLVTGGSDCHGSAKPNISVGSLKVPYDLVEKLKGARGLTDKA
ncbi:MAG: PHP domain-containing protein [Candidatus Omnitrophica bacterium]|nr:PHP domain-containing protein [Candidatus Omnitrophota bacterium]